MGLKFGGRLAPLSHGSIDFRVPPVPASMLEVFTLITLMPSKTENVLTPVGHLLSWSNNWLEQPDFFQTFGLRVHLIKLAVFPPSSPVGTRALHLWDPTCREGAPSTSSAPGTPYNCINIETLTFFFLYFCLCCGAMSQGGT